MVCILHAILKFEARREMWVLGNTRGGTTVEFVTTPVLSAPRCFKTEVPAFSDSKFKAVIRIKLGDTWISQRVKILEYVTCDCEGIAAKEEIFLNVVDPKMDCLFLNRVTRGTGTNRRRQQASVRARSRQLQVAFINNSVQFIFSRCLTETPGLTPTSKRRKEISILTGRNPSVNRATSR